MREHFVLVPVTCKLLIVVVRFGEISRCITKLANVYYLFLTNYSENICVFTEYHNSVNTQILADSCYQKHFAQMIVKRRSN